MNVFPLNDLFSMITKRSILVYPGCLNYLYLKDLGIVENIGVEPMTSCVQGRRSSQLS